MPVVFPFPTVPPTPTAPPRAPLAERAARAELFTAGTVRALVLHAEAEGCAVDAGRRERLTGTTLRAAFTLEEAGVPFDGWLEAAAPALVQYTADLCGF